MAERKRIGLRGDEKGCAETAKFASETVANVERHAQRRGGYTHAQRERGPCQKFVARAASKRIGD